MRQWLKIQNDGSPMRFIAGDGEKFTIANPDIIRRDSFNLKPGMEIRIPNNIQGIIEAFEELNK